MAARTRGAAAGIASADFGPANAILMGVLAARLHGTISHAISKAVVAVPAQRNAITLADRTAAVRFVKRDTARLYAERQYTELGTTLVTTPEQTVLDLTCRPALGDAEDEVAGCGPNPIARVNVDLLDELAVAQRTGASLRRARGRALAPSR